MEQTTDKGLFSNKISPASFILSSLNNPITSGIGVLIGQLALHLGFFAH